MSVPRGRVRGRREVNRRTGRVFYNYHYEVTDGRKVIHADNCADWQRMFDMCHAEVGVVRRARELGARWKRSWAEEVDRAAEHI